MQVVCYLFSLLYSKVFPLTKNNISKFQFDLQTMDGGLHSVDIPLQVPILLLKCYYDQKITFIFSSDFETMFIKHSPSEIISLNFEKKTVNLNCNFPV